MIDSLFLALASTVGYSVVFKFTVYVLVSSSYLSKPSKASMLAPFNFNSSRLAVVLASVCLM